MYLYLRDSKVSSHETWLKLTFIFIIHITESVYWKNIWQIISKFVWLMYCNHCRFQQLIWKIGLDRASIVGKLKPTAAILEWPPEEYSGIIEKEMRTLTFSTQICRTKYVDWALIILNDRVLSFFFVTRATENMANIWPPLTTIKAYCEAHKILSLVMITFKVVD